LSLHHNNRGNPNWPTGFVVACRPQLVRATDCGLDVDGCACFWSGGTCHSSPVGAGCAGQWEEKDSFGLCKQNNPAVRVVACGGRRRYEGGAGPGLRL
jgi:hypothetical protein